MEEAKNEIVESKLEGNKGILTVRMPIVGKVVHSPFQSSASANVKYKFQPPGQTRFNSSDVSIYDSESIPDKFQDQVRLARYYYHFEPITGTVIDVLVMFSISQLEHVTDDESVKDFYDAIYETSNIKDIIKSVFLEYYVAANGWPYRSERGELVKSRGGKEVPQYKWTVLNPEKVNIEGTMLFDDGVIITLEPTQELKSLVNKNDKISKQIIGNLPKEMVQAIKSGKNIPLDSDRVYHIARNKQPFERYAVPFIMRNVGPLRVKEKLMEMDLSTADGVINQLVTITTGSDECPAQQEDLNNLAEAFQTVSKAYSLIWNHTLKVQFHKPEANFFDAKKYEQVNMDIAAGYGIARALIDKSPSSYATQNINIKALIQWLEQGRDDIKRWLEHEYAKIAEENNLPTYPKVRFRKVNLQEERTIKNVLMNLYDRNIISAETMLTETDHEFDMEVERLKQEKDIREKEGIFIPQSPYQQSKDSPKSINPDGGRPDGEEDSEPRDRTPEPEPTGASMIALAYTEEEEIAMTAYFNELIEVYDKAMEKLHGKITRTTDRDIQNDLVYAAMATLVAAMKNIHDKHMSQMFLSSYEKISGEPVPDSIYQEYYPKLLEWNMRYTNEFVKRVGNQIGLLLDAGVYSAVLDVFDKEAYRVELYAEEGVKKSQAYGYVAAYRKSGHTRGRWNAIFENTCEVCAGRHGQIFSMEEIMEMYPAHNHCKCFIDFI